MENQLLPYRPTHKLTVSFMAGGVNYHVVDTDYPIDNNKKLPPQLSKLCAELANLPEGEISNIKVIEYKRYPKIKIPEFSLREAKVGEYWLCAIDGFELPRVFRREAGGWQVGHEVSESFMGGREIKPLSRLYTQRDVFDVHMLLKLSARTVKQLKSKMAKIESRVEVQQSKEEKQPRRKSITEHLHGFLMGLSLSR
ncbi:hypothetical protein P3551_23045 [Vibrio parahaemolyticus]|uniref:hypothetical protein n=1 Tax=Vibrio parahaemolyticus TaxID=670 RepID=UPI0011236351|nr:hypothetical protein [Vibrio parahaemolyticus]MBE3985605.1 hypothetical protein [Vibrio parahaemolyticus]MBE4286381.1 hypothetical protein [Vibrio parahaemolyticus]MDF4902163.1 hypothetical protein [Vibrio parahaemolyticus]TOH19138.1 hypothetical protein CGI90_03935 [Vibrio parahaemolyticus]HCG7330422.1 hypothetical protein [Vibrio parahaemolyticus]